MCGCSSLSGGVLNASRSRHAAWRRPRSRAARSVCRIPSLMSIEHIQGPSAPGRRLLCSATLGRAARQAPEGARVGAPPAPPGAGCSGPFAATGCPPGMRGCSDGDRDRTRQEGPSRLRLRRHRDRALAAHARPRRHRHLLEARALPVRAADARLGDGRRRLARDRRHHRPPGRARRAQPRGHLHALRGRRGAARADRAAAEGSRHARDAGDLPRARQAGADRAADPRDQGAESRRRRLADTPARARTTTRSRWRPVSTCS